MFILTLLIALVLIIEWFLYVTNFMPLLLVRYDYLNVLDGCFRKMKSYILLTIIAKVDRW